MQMFASYHEGMI